MQRKAIKAQSFLILFSLITLNPRDVFAYSVTDALFIKQWSLRQIQAPQAWEYGVGKPEVVVAVIDTGVDARNPDLQDAFWTNPGEIPSNGIDDDGNGITDDIHGWNFIDHSSSTLPMRSPGQTESSYGHGTAVASLIAATANGYGMVGVAPGVKIMPLVVLNADGYGNNQDLVKAIRYAIEKKVRIMNISITGYEPDDELRYALQDAQNAGIIVVSAVGNSAYEEGDDLSVTPVFPACHGADNATATYLRVTGTDSLDQHAPYANYGSACTDIAAPGHELLGAQPIDLPMGSEATTTVLHAEGLTGTSVASPLVAGAAALLASQQPKLTGAEIRRLLIENTDLIEPGIYRGERGQLGYGRLNVLRAVQASRGQFRAEAPKQKREWGLIMEFWLGVLR